MNALSHLRIYNTKEKIGEGEIMNSIKKQILKGFIKMNVVENRPGMLKIHIKDLNAVKKEIRMYDYYVIWAIKLLKGINDVIIDYQKNILTVAYDKEQVKPQLIYKWLHVIIDVVIDHLDFIKKYSANNILMVEQKLLQVLQGKVAVLQESQESKQGK